MAKANPTNAAGNGYGGGNNTNINTDIDLDVKGDRNTIQVIIHYMFG